MSDGIRLPDNVTPNWVEQKKDRDNGGMNTFYGVKGESAHGHSHQNDQGVVDYARTIGGKELPQ